MAAKIIDGSTVEGRGAIGLASILTDAQADAATAAKVKALKSSEATCSDCGEVFKITELDGSTALCEVCYEVAGAENELQDGLLSEEDYEKLKADLGYKGSA